MPETESWQVSGSAAAVYESALVPALFVQWVEHVLDAAAVSESDAVLDVGCGTGVLARSARKRVGGSGRVIGLDLNDGMLAVAESVAPDVDWVAGDAAALPFEDGVFDAVVSQFALMYFPDRVAALSSAARVLVPGGRAAFAVWGTIDRCDGYRRTADVFEQLVGPEAAEILRAPHALGDPDSMARLMQEAGFDAVSVMSRTGAVTYPSMEMFVAMEIDGTPLADHIARAGEGIRAGVIDELGSRLEEFSSPEGFSFPIDAVIATGTAPR